MIKTKTWGTMLESLCLPAWLPPDIWPFETFTLPVDGTEIALSIDGEGPTLLFYTGIGSFVWRDVVAALSRSFRCVVVDPPGIGLSAAIPSDHISLERSARAVCAVLRALELSDVTIVAHDTGGPPAFAAAGRLAHRVRALVGLNTFGWRPSGAAFRGMLAFMGSDVVRRIDLATGLLPRITVTAFGVGRHLDRSSREAYRVGIAHSLGAFHEYLREAHECELLYDELARAFSGPLGRLPLLTIFGERNDPLGFQPQWKALFPSARQITIPKGHHFPMCDDPDFVADEIRRFHERGRSYEMETRP